MAKKKTPVEPILSPERTKALVDAINNNIGAHEGAYDLEDLGNGMYAVVMSAEQETLLAQLQEFYKGIPEDANLANLFNETSSQMSH